MVGKKQQRDPVTGLAMVRQAGMVPEEYLNDDGSFSLTAFNAATGEVCDIANVGSMAQVYDYAVDYFKRRLLPELDYVIRIGPVRLSCTSSLRADAAFRVPEARERRRAGGQFYGRGMPRKTDISSGTRLEISSISQN